MPPIRARCSAIEGRRGRFLPDLLVAALQRAVALAEMDGGALAVAHAPGFRCGAASRGTSRGRASRRRRRRAPRRARWRAPRADLRRARDLHAAAAAAGGRLDEHGIADLGGDLARLDVVRDAAFRAGDDRDAEARGRALGLDLVAHDADVLGARADEGDLVGGEDLGEAGVLGEEAVARVDGVGAGDLAGGEDLRDVEVGFAGRRRPDADALVGEPDMHGIGIGGRMHRDGGDAEFLAGAQHAEGDLAAIGDQDLLERGGGALIR